MSMKYDLEDELCSEYVFIKDDLISSKRLLEELKQKLIMYR